MGYQTQLTEMQYRINQMQKDHAQEIDKIIWQSSADLKVKDVQIEAMQRAQTLMQQRLKQAEDAINEYMANPILDPTTHMGKDSQIKKLQEEVTIVKDMNIDLLVGYKSRLQHKDNEIEELKKPIAQLQTRAAPEGIQRPSTSQTTRRPLALEGPTTFHRIEFE